jgi:predicted membrane chloride channel (bestrophin family)
MKRHLSPEDEDEADFKNELYEKLPYNQAKNIIKAAHRPNRALQDLSYAIDALPMHFTRKNQIHEAATIFEDNLGSSERLLTSPVPLFYTRHTARFLSAWLLLLPFALYEPFKGTWNHVGMIPATALLGVFLFGIDEIATQLEEPFTILPMQAFCDKIYNWCFEISSFARGDNGQEVKKVKPEHQYFAAVSPPIDTPHHKYVQVKDVGAIKTDDENNLFPLSFEEFLATQRKK